MVSAAEASTVVDLTVVDSGSTGHSDEDGFGYGRRFGFYGGSPYFYGAYGYGCSPYYFGSYECY